MPDTVYRKDSPSLRPYLGVSLAIHAVVFALIVVLVHTEQGRLTRQEDLFIDDVRQLEQEQERQERQAREEAVKEMLAEELKIEMDELIAEELAPKDEETLSEMTRQDIEQRVERLEEQAGELNLDALSNERYDELSEGLSAEAFEQMRLNLREMKQDLLLSQVRAFVRSHVAPEIRRKIDRGLKQELGERLRRETAAQSARERSARLGDVGKELQDAIRQLGGLRSQEDRVRSDLQRRRFDRAAKQQADLAPKAAANAESVRAILDKVSRVSPALAPEAAQLGNVPPERRIPPAIDTAAAAIDQTKAAAAKRAELDPKKADPKTRADRDAAVAAAQAQAVARAQETSATMAGRISELQALSKKLTEEQRRGEPDDIQKEVVAAATVDVEAAARREVEKQVRETAIPLAAGRIVTALDADLKRRKLDDEKFRTFLERDIAQALDEEMTRKPPEARLSLMKTREQFRLRTREDLEAARKAAAEAARKLRQLAAEEEKLRDEVRKESAGRDAVRQYDFVGRVADGRKEIVRTLDRVRRATLTRDREVDQAARDLAAAKVEETALQAGKEIEQKKVPEARKLMTDVVAALRQSAGALETIEKGLAEEAAALENVAARQIDLEKALGEKAAQKAVADVAGTAGKQVDENVRPLVARAAQSVNVNNILGQAADAEALRRMDALEAKLDQVAANLAEGRGLGEYPGAGLMGPGMGLGIGGIPGADDGLYWPPGYRRRMSRFNREAYEAFIRNMRDRLNPAGYYAQAEAVEGLDSVAGPPDDDVPRIVFVEAPPKVKAEEPAERRRVPKPEFEYLQFGAAAMMEKPPVIDGDLSDWGELRHGIRMQYTNKGQKISDGPTLYARWSPDGFYFGYKVKDTDGIQPCKEYSWSGDCLEVMVDMPNSRRLDAYRNVDSQKFDFTPFGCKGRTDVTAWEMGRGLRGMVMAGDYPIASSAMGRSAAKLIPGYGYSVECFLSRRVLTKPYLVPGRYVGLNFIINQNYGSGTLWSSPADFNTWRRPNTWGDVLLLGSDARLKFVRAGGDEGVEGEAAKGVIPGDVLALEIADADMNLNSLKVDRVAARLVSKDSGHSLFVVLRETGLRTGVFRGSVNTQSYFMPPRENTLNVRSGGTVEIVYTDARTEFGEKDRKVTADLPVGWPVMKLGAR